MTIPVSPSDVESAAEQAHKIHEHATQVAAQWRRGGEELAKIIYLIRTVQVGDKYIWEWMGHSDEKSYFAAPLESGGLDLGARMVDRYFTTHRDLHVICGIPQSLYGGLDRDKQDIARRLLVQDGRRIADDEMIAEVLTQARALSRSDFRQWVREQAGDAPQMVAASDTYQYENTALPIHDDDMVARGGDIWFDMMKGHRCCLKPWTDGERAHVPVSKGAGGKDWRNCVVPLNSADHREQHQEGIDTWLAKNKQPLFRFLYRTIFVLLEENRRLKSEKDNH